MSDNSYLGIDVGKTNCHVALLMGDQRARAVFSNDAKGFANLGHWLAQQEAHDVHACMEATGRYWRAIAVYLVAQGHRVSVENPRRIKHHAQTQMQRNKEDGQDALTIADYCRKHQPALWQPRSANLDQLQELTRHHRTLNDDRTRTRNRLQSGLSSPAVIAMLEAQLKLTEAQIAEVARLINDHIDQDPDLKADRELLKSIPGIGDIVSATVLAEGITPEHYPHVKRAVAAIGLSPGRHQSGNHERRGRLIKWGNVHLRTALYMPALSAHRWNPTIQRVRERAIANGHSGLPLVVIIMRKLFTLCYGVLKTGVPYDPLYAALESNS